MKTEKDDFLLGLMVFLVVFDSRNRIKAEKKNSEVFLMWGFASKKNPPKGDCFQMQISISKKIRNYFFSLLFCS